MERRPSVSLSSIIKNNNKKIIGILTSGGDSQGMNSAIRAVVRAGIYAGCVVYFIKEGYMGLMEGGSYIVEATWESVSNIIQTGGTVIGTSRCPEMRTVEGRRKAVKNLISHGIDNIVCIGGDGSLTGLDFLRNEWSSHVEELIKNGEVSPGKSASHLNIVGIVGSIDNDFCGTDMTIGADSALHRIMEAVDAISTTATSHQRCFVLELMGRNCGYLTLLGAMMCEVDYAFIPEVELEKEWKECLIERLSKARHIGKRLSIVLVCEGPIGNGFVTTDDIIKVIKEDVNIDCRKTVLGHVQRGGDASVFDRILGIRMGTEAVNALLDRKQNEPACVIALSKNNIVRLNLQECVAETSRIHDAMAANDLKRVVELRGPAFARSVELFRFFRQTMPVVKEKKRDEFRLGIVNIGAPACGTNAAARAFSRAALAKGLSVLGALKGLEGFINDNVVDIDWSMTVGWTGLGGAELETSRKVPADIGFSNLAQALNRHRIKALLVIGGFEGFVTIKSLYEKRGEFNEFCIPIVLIPSTISNNVPGSDFSLGCDTALNEIVSVCDKLKLSSSATKRRVFVVGVMGAHCGYLCTMGSLASGADAAYIFEEKFKAEDIIEDAQSLVKKMTTSVARGLVLVTEDYPSVLDINVITRLLASEGEGVYDCRQNVIGHLQQGSRPMPFDRINGTKFGVKAFKYVYSMLEPFVLSEKPIFVDYEDSVAVIGIIGSEMMLTSVAKLAANADFKNRIPKTRWWKDFYYLVRILSNRDYVY